MNRLKTSLIGAFSFILVLQGCGLFSSVSYYDPTTHRNLIELKIYTQFLYDSFKEDSLDTRDIKYVRIKLKQILEYEKNKGAENDKTYQQVKLILEDFDDYVTNRKERGTWNETQYKNAIDNTNKLFDIAIESEKKKNIREY